MHAGWTGSSSPMRRLPMISESNQLVMASKISKKSSLTAGTHSFIFSSHSTQFSFSRCRIQYAFARVTDPNVGADQTPQDSSELIRLLIRAIFPSSCRSTGAEMVFQRRRRVCFIHTPLPLPASSAGRMSSSARAMRSVTDSTSSTVAI